MQDIIDQFRDAMRAAGIDPPKSIVPDGKLRRFNEGKSRSFSGWYCLHLDGLPAGSFGSWRSGISETWCSKAQRKLSQAERDEIAKRIAEQRKQRDEEAERARLKAQQKSEYLYGIAKPPLANHDYLVRKQIKAVGHARQLRQSLIIPIRDEHGKLHSLQFIQPDGTKRFITGGRVDGCYTTIGRPSERILICEGFSTGASLFEATGHAVVIAFNAGNLMAVARAMRAKFPDRELVICADNDHEVTEPVENPGLHYATDAARAVNALLCFPPVHAERPSDTDFNDLFVSQGATSVCDVVLEASLPRELSSTFDGAAPPPEAAAHIINPDVPSPEPPPLDLSTIDDTNSVDTLTPLPDDRKGKPLATIENLVEIMQRLGVQARYNVIRKDEELLIPGASFTVDNRANASLAWLNSWCARFKMPTDKLSQYVTAVADRNLFNPVATWITSKPWDGTTRLPQFFDTVRVAPDDEELRNILIRRWLISACAAAFNPAGVSAHGVLVFQGAQYMGKTAWFKRLVPQALGLTADGMTLKPDDKDSISQALSFWLVELGELDATFKKSDIAQLKAFVTRDKDVFRKPYMPKPSEYARRTVFFASVNDDKFLQDPTGNRRFWTISCESLNFAHNVDMQQLWAEIKALYDFGEPWVLDAREMAMLNKSNEAFAMPDPIEEKILDFYNWDELRVSNSWMTATKALESTGWRQPSPSESKRAANVIRKLNGGEQRKYQGSLQFKMPLPRRST